MRSGAPYRPAAAASPVASWRAAASAARLDVDAVSVKSPSNDAGRPSASRSQPTVTSSSSVAAGLVRHSMALATSVLMSISPRMPGPEAVDGK